jgi:transposase
MTERPTIVSERVDDLPLLVAQMCRMDLPTLLDSRFVTHGNRRGLSLGWTTVVWLTHLLLLSQGDHRLNQVQPWAARRLETLRACTRQPVQELDLSDDRLADVLRTLADDTHWVSFERALGQTLLRVYELQPACVRLDMTTASREGQVSAEGLFQFGYSKDQRPDVPQVKVALASLDPLGLPLITEVVPGDRAGDRADDPLYVPLVKRVGAIGLPRGLLYVGDCKMAALLTRATIAERGDHYLCPLPATQVPPDVLDAYLATARAGGPPERAERVQADGTTEHLADCYECREVFSAVVDGWRGVQWTERRLLLRSLAQAQLAESALRARVARAQQTITELTVRRRGKPRLPTVEAVQQAAAAVLAHERVEELVHVTVSEHVQDRPVRAYAGRPARVRQTRTLHAQAVVDADALEAAVQRLGWRVYATNAPAEDLPATQAVLAYRQEYLIERAFGRLKGRPLSLTPLYLERDDHVRGLLRLLSIALRVLTTVEHTVRQRLAQQQRSLAGLYAGSPTRATAQPTAERLLEAFKELTLTLVQLPQATLRHLTVLSPLQQEILALLGLSSDAYAMIEHYSPQPP